MNFKKWTVLATAFLAGITMIPAQETNEVEQLKRQLQETQRNLEQTQAEQRQQIQSLTQKLEALAATNAVVPAPAPPAADTPAWSPAEPIRVGRGGSYVDISLVATFAAGGSTAKDIEGGTQPGGHDPNQNGFTIQGVEANFQGAVDPYFRGNANIVFSVDAEGESFLELEEAWLETLSLPANLQVRAGQYLSEFGRINTQHPHTWAFVDSPLISTRLLGEDGLRNPGARISWLAPTPFYSEIMLGVQDSQGETAASFRNGEQTPGNAAAGPPPGYRFADNDRGVRNAGDLLFTPRVAASFDLTDQQTLLAGVSGAFGPNSSGAGGNTRTEIYGVDLYWKWKSPRAEAGFPFVSFQGEAMLRRFALGTYNWQTDLDAGGTPIVDEDTGLPAVMRAETVRDYGFYAQFLYGFKLHWVAGVRFDWVGSEDAGYEKRNLTLDGEPLGRDPQRAPRWRISPDLTWYPSEFSKLRLQYNYDDRDGIGVDNSIWLQFEFLLGAHAAHKF